MPFTPNGLVIPRQPEIINDLVADQQIRIHPNINTSPDTFIGENNVVFSRMLSLAYEYLEKAYSQTRLSSAEGLALDEIGIKKGITRIAASPSSVYLTLIGINDIYIPANTLVQDPVTKQKYITQTFKRIFSESCVQAEIRTTSQAPSTTYAITVNGTTYSRTTSSSSVDINATLNQLASDVTIPGITATVTGTVLTLYTPAFSEFSVTLNSNLAFNEVRSKVKAKSVNTGADTAATPGDWKILNAVPGWNKVIPRMSTSSPGTDKEEDETYRIRIATDDGAGGKGTTRAVQRALQNVSGVTHVNVEENTSAVTVGGIPPYTIHCIVDGGDSDIIAKTIWETKGSTTPTVGTQVVSYADENGISRIINFDRPVALTIDVQITAIINSEETLTSDWQNVLKNSVSSYVDSLGLGKDVYPSKIYFPIYRDVSGVVVTDIKLRQHGTSTWLSTPITAPPSQFAKIAALTDITII